MPKTLRFFEYDRVAFKGKWRTLAFKKEYFEAFESYYISNPDTPFFEMIPYGVRFKQYVGAIQIGNTTIEVLPKSGRQGNEDEWQGVLLDMLKTCQLLTAKETGEAQLKLKSNSILELYFELYLIELEQLCRLGLIKKYQKQSGQQKALKGPIQFSINSTKNLVHKERFYINYTTYSKDHLLHQVLFEGLIVISRLSNSTLLRDYIERLIQLFPDVKSLKVNAKHFDRIETSRKNKPYEKAVAIAKLILLNYRPDIRTGKKDLLAIMFDMNVLWEEYVFRILKKNNKKFKVYGQNKKLFWSKNQKIKPDVVLIHKETEKYFVIDTKWKVIKTSRPADDDLKQMYVYNHHWNATQSILLYPKSHNQKDVSGDFALHFNDESHSCQLAFADVLVDGKLNRNLHQQILNILR